MWAPLKLKPVGSSIRVTATQACMHSTQLSTFGARDVKPRGTQRTGDDCDAFAASCLNSVAQPEHLAPSNIPVWSIKRICKALAPPAADLNAITRQPDGTRGQIQASSKKAYNCAGRNWGTSDSRKRAFIAVSLEAESSSCAMHIV